jgi:glutathione peroxidase
MATAIQDIPLKTIKGEDSSLGNYAGKVLLVVNVASKCGLTPQYEGLEALYRKYRDQGLVVIGMPANDFAGQEPGTDEEIAEFCTTNYGVDFPMMSKIAVTGPEQHPLYNALTNEHPDTTGDTQTQRDRLTGYGITPTDPPNVLWNFEKFLIGRDGKVADRFAPGMAPDDPTLVAAIEKALKA